MRSAAQHPRRIHRPGECDLPPTIATLSSIAQSPLVNSGYIRIASSLVASDGIDAAFAPKTSEPSRAGSKLCDSSDDSAVSDSDSLTPVEKVFMSRRITAVRKL